MGQGDVFLVIDSVSEYIDLPSMIFLTFEICSCIVLTKREGEGLRSPSIEEDCPSLEDP